MTPSLPFPRLLSMTATRRIPGIPPSRDGCGLPADTLVSETVALGLITAVALLLRIVTANGEIGEDIVDAVNAMTH